MNKIIKEQLKLLKPSATLAINEESNRLEKEGKKIYRFGFGQSPFPIPESVISALKLNADKNKYLPMQGLEELRKSIASNLNKNNNNNFNSENIIVGPGSKELMLLTQLAFDGEILLPIPSWVSYQPQALIGKNKVHWINTSSNSNWFPTAKDLENKIKSIKCKNLMLFINSPNNPSGTTCKNLKEISEVAKKYKLIILSDEIYSKLSFGENYKSISNYYSEGTIVSSGLSKWCGAGGWRLGYFIIPDELNDIKKTINVLASETFSAVSAPIQYAAIKAYENDHSSYITKSVNILSAVGKYVFSNLKSNKVLINEPHGGFYLMPEFLNNKFKTSSDMCKDILNNTGVALLPGSDFGFNPDKMLARLSFTDFDGQEFMNNIDETKIIDENLINKFAPKVVEGVNKLKNWSESL